ncbi:tropomodulin-4 isoform X1 [Apodemus sylvaticus]|uniref:tropomodulin-4 isoform X1 n=1 Tax=Apodemus sylvaticus TaxID=10129 RepID=UPI00224497EF|nr:tropomodulin-4 isoform X1 [Apodemus sylvaticus]XP_052035774.1 tropomodulin-4 isoform X1 [Apodemus sylvaticus]
MSSYQKELEKYRDIDEDEILRTLSPEELEQLDCELQEMDPENMLLPAGLRQRDQTKKSPTGPLDRDALLQYLEQQALEVKERDDLVPYTGEKKGKPFIEPKREIPAEEQITLEPELEEALSHATDAEMCDIAAILGMYTLMSNKQYYDAICSGEICNTEGISSVVQPDKYKPVPDEPPNPTNIEEMLKRVRSNDKELEEVNLNNIQDIPIPVLSDLCEAMKTNTYVRSFSLVATKSGDPIANAVADMLRENRSLQSLNIESNFISSTGLMAVLKAVRENATLTELRVDNQRQWPGDAVEMEMATVLEQCPSIVRFGYHFTQQGPRARAAHAMTRNNELRESLQTRVQRRGQLPRGVDPEGTRGDKCMGGGKHTQSESQGDRKVLLPQIHTYREVGVGGWSDGSSRVLSFSGVTERPSGGRRQHLMRLPKERKETHPCPNNSWSSVYRSSFPGRQQKKR